MIEILENELIADESKLKDDVISEREMWLRVFNICIENCYPAAGAIEHANNSVINFRKL